MGSLVKDVLIRSKCERHQFFEFNFIFLTEDYQGCRISEGACFSKKTFTRARKKCSLFQAFQRPCCASTAEIAIKAFLIRSRRPIFGYFWNYEGKRSLNRLVDFFRLAFVRKKSCQLFFSLVIKRFSFQGFFLVTHVSCCES